MLRVGMRDLRVATAQFENRNGDKAYNLSVIDALAGRAAAAGAGVVAFHECSVTAYSFARKLSREQLFDLAEEVPGPSVATLTDIARRHQIAVLAGCSSAPPRVSSTRRMSAWTNTA
jgi:predicted amidohydrolase